MLEIAGGEVRRVSSIVNPDKLGHLGPVADMNELLGSCGAAIEPADRPSGILSPAPSASISSPSLSGVVIGVSTGSVIPPATNCSSRSRICSGVPRMSMSSISSQGAASTARGRSFAAHASHISAIASPWPSQR